MGVVTQRLAKPRIATYILYSCGIFRDTGAPKTKSQLGTAAVVLDGWRVVVSVWFT